MPNRCFNTTGFENMRDPKYPGGASVMFVCGDDESATATASDLAADLGFDAVALGPLRHARELEPFALIWIRMAMQLGHGRDSAFGRLHRGTAEAEVG